MSEFAIFQKLGSLGVHVRCNPNSTYSFVGSGIPVDLCYIARDGGKADPEDLAKGQRHGFGFVPNVKIRVFPTCAAAWEAAAEFGIAPCKCCSDL